MYCTVPHPEPFGLLRQPRPPQPKAADGAPAPECEEEPGGDLLIEGQALPGSSVPEWCCNVMREIQCQQNASDADNYKGP